MRQFLVAVCGLAAFVASPSCAQDAPEPAPTQNLPVETSWVGNTFGSDGKWVQDYIDEIDVAPDGTVYTASVWDEAGRCSGIYKDGDVNTVLVKQFDGKGGHKAWGWGTAGEAVAVDGTYHYLVNTEGELLRFRRDDQKFVDATPVGKAVGMTVAGGNIYIVRDNGDILTRRASDLSQVGTFNVPTARDVAIDRKSTLWVLTSTQILRFNAQGVALPEKITDAGKPTAISVDNKGRLVVCDNGPRLQVLFYDISGKPRLAGTFGDRGGIAGGNVGVVTPTKLFHLAGAGTDAAGNVYVALSGGAWDGAIIRKFTPQGSLVWEVNGLHFLDTLVVDPASDGTIVYGGEERYEMDYSKPPGSQWTLRGYTFDPASPPDEPRRKEGSYHVAWVRRVGGNLMLFKTPMHGNHLQVYTKRAGRGEFFYRTYEHKQQVDGWGVFADTNGGIWECGDKKISMTALQSFNAQGEPQYGATTFFDAPAPFESLQRVQYLPDTDTMYLAGYTADKKEETWGIVGKVMARYDNWSKGNREAAWVTDVPHDFKPQTGPKVIMKAMAIEGDYVFLVGVETRARVYVYSAKSGQFVGHMNPGPAVGALEDTGWVDMPNALSAFRRKSGEYLVFVEEDHRNKVILYRWNPAANP
jgi:hypothetical protein